MVKYTKENAVAKYSGLDGIEFISYENTQEISKDEIPDNLLEYQELEELLLSEKSLEVIVYTLDVIDEEDDCVTCNVLGYKLNQ